MDLTNVQLTPAMDAFLIPPFPSSAPPLLLAQAAPEEGFIEVLIWGIGILLLVVALFVVKKWLRARAEGAARTSELTFGMSASDLEALKKTGVTEEELKRIRQAMGRRFLERQQEEEKKRQLPPAAQAVLAKAEAEELARLAGKTQPTEGEHAVVPEAGPPPPPTQPPATFTRPKPAVPPSALPPLPEELQRLVGKSDLEIEELLQAGFLSPEDAQRVREAKGQ